jgi:glycosyltransferase involved in cell wall biosynthesis
MVIGIDISQVVYEGTGVGKFVREMTSSILRDGKNHSFILFGSSWGRRNKLKQLKEHFLQIRPDVRFVLLPLPLRLLDFLWNRLHVFPIEWLLGKMDIYWSSDWVQPPSLRAKMVTTIHDTGVYKYPQEAGVEIRDVHIRRMRWVRRECDAVFCDSYATLEDVIALGGFEPTRLHVVYPGFSL